ncbi:MAG: VCBS repeat-containing protein [bacterium]|nr:VCBS repeat-containing protein [bacterium]
MFTKKPTTGIPLAAPLCVLALIVCFCQPAVAGTPRLQIDVTVEEGAITIPFSPIAVQLDFAALLKEAGIPGRVAPNSIAVARVEDDGAEAAIPHALSEDFAWEQRGTVSWVAERPSHRHYRICADTLGHGPFAPPAVTPIIGAGDNPRYNRPGGADPIHCHGIRPVLGDFDGDGRTDVVSRQIYTSTWGQPRFTIWFWRNVGTEEAPVYEDYVRLRADGEVIPNHYSGCDLYDWDGDGRLDLMTARSVYRNTGDVEWHGTPVLTKVADLPDNGLKGRPYCFFMGMADHDADGVFDAIYQLSGVHYDYEGPPPRNFVEGALYRWVNTAGPGAPPSFGKTEPFVRDGQIWTENYLPSSLVDMDNDGDLDLVGNSRPLDRIPAQCQVCYWPNIAQPGAAPEYGRCVLVPDTYNMSSYSVLPGATGPYEGLLLPEGHRVRYLHRTDGTWPSGAGRFERRDLLRQQRARCGVDGYSCVEVEDWEGDGDWDLMAGDEFGTIWLIENTGTNTSPVFQPSRPIEANEEPIRIMRWHYLQDGNPEYWLGQSKPAYQDWDGDGDHDIVTANNTDRVVLFENVGSRQAPYFTRSEVIAIGDDPAPFAKRRKPSLVDWNGDGVMDLVTSNPDEQTCLFLGNRDEGHQRVMPGVPLLTEAGTPLKAPQGEVCDWDGDGDWDIIAQIGDWGGAGPGYFENAGSNDDPRFLAPVRLACWGTEICLSAHEHSFAAVDWYGTGQLDLMCGGECGWFFFFRRTALDAPAPPAVSVTVAKEAGANE